MMHCSNLDEYTCVYMTFAQLLMSLHLCLAVALLIMVLRINEFALSTEHKNVQ